ncbi:unnamed protein product [Heterosigma akashiwo]
MHSSLENKIVAGGQAFLSAGPPNGASNGGGKTDDKALALWLACINGHTGDIPSLIKDFNDIEHRYPSFEGNTVFHAAALYGQTEVLKLLLNLKDLDPAAAEHFRGGGGARSRRGPHLQNDRGQTPLVGPRRRRRSRRTFGCKCWENGSCQATDRARRGGGRPRRAGGDAAAREPRASDWASDWLHHCSNISHVSKYEDDLQNFS